MNYKDYNDYELINYAVSDNNSEANKILLEKYRPLIISFSKKMLPYCSNAGIELNDLMQEGLLGLTKAIDRFNEQKNITFYTFAKTCIERNIITVVVGTRRLKHKILNESVSLEVKNADNEVSIPDYMISDKSYNPEELLINSEREEILNASIKTLLTDFELQVYELKLNHFSYDEISNILEINKKAVDNALQRIKGKIKEILKELD